MLKDRYPTTPKPLEDFHTRIASAPTSGNLGKVVSNPMLEDENTYKKKRVGERVVE